MSYLPKIISHLDLIEITKKIAEDTKFDADKIVNRKSASPKQKREKLHNADFWFSIHEHLKTIKHDH